VEFNEKTPGWLGSWPWHASPHPSTPRTYRPSARRWTSASPATITGGPCSRATTSPSTGWPSKSPTSSSLLPRAASAGAAAHGVPPLRPPRRI